MAENLQAIEETETRTSRARPWLRTALAVVGVAAAFGSAGPAMATASAGHEATAHKTHRKKAHHKHHKAAAQPVAETPVQKAVTSTLQNLAAQIVANYNQAKSNLPYKGVAYDDCPTEAYKPGYGPGKALFCMEYPVGTANAAGAGEYMVTASLDYPSKDINQPTTANLKYVSEVLIEESTTVPNPAYAGPGYSQTVPGPVYDFDAEGTNNAWDVYQSISTASYTVGPPEVAGLPPVPIESGTNDEWEYVTAPSSVIGNGVIGHMTYTPLTIPELQTEAGVAQTMLTNAEQYSITPVSLALAAQLPPPNGQLPCGGATIC